MNRNISFLFFSLYSLVAYAQPVEYARCIIDSLCKPEMHGRGYVNKGDQRAAEFIVSEFKKHGIGAMNGEFYQPFNISVNQTVGRLLISVDGKILNPGKDYIVNPESPSARGNFKLMHVYEEDLLNDHQVNKIKRAAKDNLLVIWPAKNALNEKEEKVVSQHLSFLRFNPDLKLAGILYFDQKLVYYGSQHVAPRLSIQALKGSVPENAKTMQVEVNASFKQDYVTQNVVGFLPGSAHSDSFIVISAHYDHLGRMGDDVYFPGANDNASGVAMLLSLSKYFAAKRPEYSMLFIAFSGEELGLLGSTYYTENPLVPLSNIKFLLNFDLAGTGDEGIKVVNGSVYKDAFDQLQALNDSTQLLPSVNSRGTACNSDHCMFYKKGVPCFYIYTLGGIGAYHDVYDIPQTLPLNEFDGFFTLMVQFISRM